jgi:predicted ATPase
MNLQITIPQIAPIEHNYKFIFKPGINLITGPNGSGKSRIAKAIFAKILKKYNASSFQNLILLSEEKYFSYVGLDTDYLNDPNVFLGSNSQKIICQKANSIYAELFNQKEVSEEIIFKNNAFVNARNCSTGESFITNLITILAYRTTNEKFKDVPLIVDGPLNVLSHSQRNMALKLLNQYIGHTILFANPSFLDYLGYEESFSKFASRYKIVVRIHKVRLNKLGSIDDDHFEIAKVSSLSSNNCKIVSF